jgi:hypothetical protein
VLASGVLLSLGWLVYTLALEVQRTSMAEVYEWAAYHSAELTFAGLMLLGWGAVWGLHA